MILMSKTDKIFVMDGIDRPSSNSMIEKPRVKIIQGIQNILSMAKHRRHSLLTAIIDMLDKQIIYIYCY